MNAEHAGEGNATIKIGSPTYRVEYWERPNVDLAWNLDAWELESCESVMEAVTWAHDNASDRRFTLYAVLREGETLDLTYVRLLGTDPNG